MTPDQAIINVFTQGKQYMANPPDIMTIEEVSAYLRVPVSSLYKLAQQGKIPAAKVGRHWRFRRELIDRYIDDQIRVGTSKNFGQQNAQGE